MSKLFIIETKEILFINKIFNRIWMRIN